MLRHLREPIEDGVTHPAEAEVEWLCTHTVGQRWLNGVAQHYAEERPAELAVLLRCMGRLHPDTVGRWGYTFVSLWGFSHGSEEVRDAALRALERWGGPLAVKLLREHTKR